MMKTRPWLFMVVVTIFAWFLSASGSFAQSCNEDLTKITSRRQAQMDVMNRLVKGSKDHKIDPVAACPQLRKLSAIEAEFLSYLTKNKDWCHVPDEAIANVTKSHGNTASFAAKACQAAAMVAKMQKQAQEGGGGGPQVPRVELPSGPL